MIRSILLASALCAATTATAQQSSGAITATLDGEARSWQITEIGGTSQSDWSGAPTSAAVSLFGHEAPDTITNYNHALAISFTATGPGPASEVEIRYLSESMLKGHVAGDDSGASLTIDAMTAEGDSLRISGNFEATLAYSDKPGHPGDPDNAMPITGAFDVTLGTRR